MAKKLPYAKLSVGFKIVYIFAPPLLPYPSFVLMKFDAPIALPQLAKLLEAEILAAHHPFLSGINEIHKVIPGDITFCDHPKYFAKALSSAASAIIVNNRQLNNPHQKTLLYHPDPFTAYNNFVLSLASTRCWQQQQPISPQAKIGQNTKIMPGAAIGDNVQIGDNCLIYPNVVIYERTIIGNNVTIHANTTIGSDAFYYKSRPLSHENDLQYEKMYSCGRVIIGNNVEIGAGCTIDCGVSGDTVIGEGSKLDNLVHIGHGVVLGKNTLIAAQVGIAGKTTLGDGVILWGQVGVSKDLTIGNNAVVYAQSGVANNLAGGKAYFGSPANEAIPTMREMANIKRIAEILERLKRLEDGQ
jgi:UDP-3-O-[3-hydroxymyristoyl] glucosamine N-acyltransferase